MTNYSEKMRCGLTIGLWLAVEPKNSMWSVYIFVRSEGEDCMVCRDVCFETGLRQKKLKLTFYLLYFSSTEIFSSIVLRASVQSLEYLIWHRLLLLLPRKYR